MGEARGERERVRERERREWGGQGGRRQDILFEIVLEWSK